MVFQTDKAYDIDSDWRNANQGNTAAVGNNLVLDKSENANNPIPKNVYFVVKGGTQSGTYDADFTLLNGDDGTIIASHTERDTPTTGFLSYTTVKKVQVNVDQNMEISVSATGPDDFKAGIYGPLQGRPSTETSDPIVTSSNGGTDSIGTNFPLFNLEAYYQSATWTDDVAIPPQATVDSIYFSGSFPSDSYAEIEVQDPAFDTYTKTLSSVSGLLTTDFDMNGDTEFFLQVKLVSSSDGKTPKLHNMPILYTVPNRLKLYENGSWKLRDLKLYNSSEFIDPVVKRYDATTGSWE